MLKKLILGVVVCQALTAGAIELDSCWDSEGELDISSYVCVEANQIYKPTVCTSAESSMQIQFNPFLGLRIEGQDPNVRTSRVVDQFGELVSTITCKVK